MALGKFIWFVDGDDCIASNALSVLLVYCQDEQLDVLQFEIRQLSSVNCDFFVTEVNTDHTFNVDTCDRFKFFSWFAGSLLAWNALYRRDFLVKHNLFFKRYPNGEDTLFGVEVALYAQKMRVISSPLYGYVQHSSGASKQKTFSHVRSILSVCAEMITSVKRVDQSGKLNTCLFRKLRAITDGIALDILSRMQPPATCYEWGEYFKVMEKIYIDSGILSRSGMRFFYLFLIGTKSPLLVRIALGGVIKIKKCLMHSNIVRRVVIRMRHVCTVWG